GEVSTLGSAGLRASCTTGERTRACRIHDPVVQSQNLADRLCDLIVTHRFDGNFRIELLAVCQCIAQPHEFGLLRYGQFRSLKIAQVIQVSTLQSFPLRSGANKCTQRLMEFFFGVGRSGHDSLRLRPALDMRMLRQTDRRSNGATAPGYVGARSLSAISPGLRRMPGGRAGGYRSSRLRATRTTP